MLNMNSIGDNLMFGRVACEVLIINCADNIRSSLSTCGDGNGKTVC